MDEDKIQQMLMEAYNSNPGQKFASSATASINDQTRKRMRDLLSKFSTTGMGRSGISGSAANEVYSGAGQEIANVGAQGASMDMNNKSNILSKLLGLYEYQDSKPGWGDVGMGALGMLGGSVLGGIGGAVGKGVGSGFNNLMGGKSWGGS